MTVDPMAEKVAVEVPGPGAYEWGTLTFQRNPWPSGMKRWPVEVELDDDGSVSVTWTESADDCYGTCDRQVRFSAEEFDHLIRVREHLQAPGRETR